MLQEEKMEKHKKDKEEIQKRFADVERRQAEEREADRERKRERARRAKEAGPEAIRKWWKTRWQILGKDISVLLQKVSNHRGNIQRRCIIE